MLSKAKSYLKRVQNFFQPTNNKIVEELENDPNVENVSWIRTMSRDQIIVHYKPDAEKLKIEHILFLFADAITNAERIDKEIYCEMIKLVRTASKYNSRLTEQDLDNAIFYLENEVWKHLYGKAYQDFKVKGSKLC